MSKVRFNSHQAAAQAWKEDAPHFVARGAIVPAGIAYLPDSFKHDARLAFDHMGWAGAMDAQASLTTAPNSGVPAFLTQWVDPTAFEILFSPNMAAKIFGEVKKGDWTTQTAFFPTVEHTGEVSSYGDYNENGSSGANTNWPQRQSYLFQTFVEYGELELERAGLQKLNWVAEQNQAAALALNKFSNLSYFFGIGGLQNYGLLNDPNLNASLTPANKAYGGNKWVVGTQVVATANEIFNDIQAIWIQLVNQAGGLIDQNAKVKLCFSPAISVAMTATNSFGVNVRALLKENFPNIEEVTAVQYGALSTTNPQGLAGGNMVQMIVDSVEGQQTGYCAFNEKMRAHKIIPGSSSWRQKQTGGTWGAIIRQPFGIASMLGV